MSRPFAAVLLAVFINVTSAARIAGKYSLGKSISACSKPVKLKSTSYAKDLKRKALRYWGNPKVLVATKSKGNVTYEDVQKHEEAAWKDTERWEDFKRNRPYSTAPYVSKAPEVGTIAPDGEVFSMDGRSSTLLTQLKSLAVLKGSTVAAVLFGSMTCPIWRGWAAYDLHTAVMGLGVPVLHVYTMEAHAANQFPIFLNTEGVLKMDEQIDETVTKQDRIKAAKKGFAHLEAEIGGDISMVIDNLSGSLEAAYESRPFRLYLIDTLTSTVLHKTGLAPFNMDAKMSDLKSFLSGYCSRK